MIISDRTAEKKICGKYDMVTWHLPVFRVDEDSLLLLLYN